MTTADAPSTPAEEPQDSCRTVQADGGPVRIHGTAELSEDDLAALQSDDHRNAA